ncbi:hypothetical protein HZC30_06545 [Candidatus Woesearchaeota archaeon]|nr:hypothetical protein [Candidatus Woesearchaeota archaeon]
MVTIALKPDTYDLLTNVKEEMEAETYDDVIKVMIVRTKKPAQSMFGKLKYVKAEFKREELDRF